MRKRQDSGWLFKKKHLPDLSGVAVDLHSHLIPGIDDGVKTIEESLKLIRQMQQMGYKKIITTPHINLHFKNSAEIIQDGLTKVKAAVQEAGIPVEVEAAAEYNLNDEFVKLMQQGKLLTFGDHFILLELHYHIPYPLFSQVIYDLQILGYKVVLAHVERYFYWHRKIEEFEKLKARDVYLQMNFMSLNFFNPIPTRKTARMLIEAGMIDFAGSDVHNDLYMNLYLRGLRSKHAEKLIASGTLKNATLL